MKPRWVLVSVVLVLLLVPAATMTLARAVQPSGGAWVRLIAFTPYAVVLYVVALLLLLLCWAQGHGGWRALAAALTAGTLAALALHAFWLAPVLTASPATAAGDEVRVMTINLTYGRASPSRVVALAVDNRVDLLVLEEVDPQIVAGLEAAGLSRVFAHSAGEPEDGAAGTMVFSTEELSDVVRLDTTFASWSMRVGDDLSLVAAHSAPPTGDTADWHADHRAIAVAAEQAAQDGDGAALVVGDLNATPDHEVLHTLGDLGYDDAATQAGSRWQPTWPAEAGPSVLGIGVPPLVAIDHVLFDRGLRVVSTDTADVDGGDHRALVAVLRR